MKFVGLTALVALGLSCGEVGGSCQTSEIIEESINRPVRVNGHKWKNDIKLEKGPHWRGFEDLGRRRGLHDEDLGETKSFGTRRGLSREHGEIQERYKKELPVFNGRRSRSFEHNVQGRHGHQGEERPQTQYQKIDKRYTHDDHVKKGRWNKCGCICNV